MRIITISMGVLAASLRSSFSSVGASEPLEGRFSFSLSTFDPSGKLDQVDRAVLASTLGTPIIAAVQGDRILMASPQILPSPFMIDDGTSRFAPITPQIAIGHTGIAADGRVLVAAAQQLAIEHAYTYDENVPIDLLLEELSLLYQEYTMKQGARPFGSTILVAFVPEEGEEGEITPQLFRIDPSGAVIRFDEGVAVLNGQSIQPSQRMEDALFNLASLSDEVSSTSSSEDLRRQISSILQKAIGTESRNRTSPPTKSSTSSSTKQPSKEEPKMKLPSFIVAASLSPTEGLKVERTPLASFESMKEEETR